MRKEPHRKGKKKKKRLSTELTKDRIQWADKIKAQTGHEKHNKDIIS